MIHWNGISHNRMIKISSIFALGIVVALTPFSGFPMSWKDFIYVVSGAGIVVLSVLIRRELHEVLKRLGSEPARADTFADGAPKAE